MILADGHGVIEPVALVAGSVAIAALALIIGFATPIASGWLLAIGLLTLANFELARRPQLLEGKISQIEFVAICAALIWLGPGALSMDAHLYGRREIDISAGETRPPDS
jgi:uncharacterized membrane protein YphA (DoxX/SURF4 family)